MSDPHGEAIEDYSRDGHASDLILHTSYGETEMMPVAAFFSGPDNFSDIESLALDQCDDPTLDAGAGAGGHSLELQSRGSRVVALDASRGCCRVMRRRGVHEVVHGSLLEQTGRYSTLLMLMNGLGLARSLEALPAFLRHCASLLEPGGQIVFDSSDVVYLYEDGLPRPPGYYGDLAYCYEYKGARGDWFPWVYVDPDSLFDVCRALGLHLDVLLSEELGQYLGRIRGF
ncbi:MAG: class I SAM-dependent methyltransferase [Pseudomonadota bacterium]